MKKNSWAIVIVGFINIALVLFSPSRSGYAAEVKADTFLITVYDDHYKVVSPPKREKQFTAIIENKTLTALVGRYQNHQGKVLKFISVDAGKFNSTQLNFELDEKIYFVPLSPSFQEVLLEVGKEAYEIPPKK